MKIPYALSFLLGTTLCLGLAAQTPAGQTPDSTHNSSAGSADKMTKPEKMSSGSHSKMDSGASGMSAADTKFAHEAAIGGMTEVELGKVAVQKASNDKVKQFGQRMIDDHTKAGDQLKSLAAKKNITLPTEMDAKSKAMVDKMSGMSGAAFDKAYMKDMVADHRKDIAEFQKEASTGSDTDLKSWASTTLPTLEEHQRLAQEANSAVGGKMGGKMNSKMSDSSSSSSSTPGK